MNRNVGKLNVLNGKVHNFLGFSRSISILAEYLYMLYWWQWLWFLRKPEFISSRRRKKSVMWLRFVELCRTVL